jgi:3-phosphoshikimate 1-carboxyvinyltransferase
MYKTVKITPMKLSGKVGAPPSKSAAHRALLGAALASGVSRILNLSYSQDIEATMNAVKCLGAEVEDLGSVVRVSGICQGENLDNVLIDCNESGSTLRFIIPIALAIGGSFSVTGRGRLLERPLDDYYKIFDSQGIFYRKDKDRIYFEGKLSGGVYELSGNVSSQYITGLLFALPMLSDDSEIVITTPLESVGYINMTLEMLSKYGIKIDASEDLRHFYIKGNQKYKARDCEIEGDYSQAAFYYVANAIGNNIEICGLSEESSQGDKAILDVIKIMNTQKDERTIDVSQIPDLVPIMTVLATQTEGTTHIVGAARLRIKESDRLSAITCELTRLSARIDEHEDSITVYGKTQLHGGVVDSHNDHRIAMSLAIAATVADNDVIISGADSVRKSYADFWDQYCSLGGKIENGE